MLSAKLYDGTSKTESQRRGAETCALPDAAVELLKKGIAGTSGDFTAACRIGAAAVALKLFLGHPGVRRSSIWLSEFGSFPPRGVLARLARRAGCELSDGNQFKNYGSQEEFLEEVRRMEGWYTQPRKQLRWHLGIDRAESGSYHERGLPTARNSKIADHYRKLKSAVRLEGLMSWRFIALATHAANSPMQSGTVPVERLWSNIQTFLPVQARQISGTWFSFLSDVAYLRYNYRHFNHHSCPAWTHSDTLLAERAETLFDVVRSLQDTGDCSVAHVLAASCEKGGSKNADSEGCDRELAAKHPDTLSDAQSDGRLLLLCWSSPAVLCAVRSCETHIPGVAEGIVQPGSFQHIFAEAVDVDGLTASFETWIASILRDLFDQAPLLTTQLLHGNALRKEFGLLCDCIRDDLVKQHQWPCCARSLHGQWAEALAQGHKWFEFQRYNRHALNQLEWCQSGGIMIFGATKCSFVSGIAILRGVVKGSSAEDVPIALGLVPHALRAGSQIV